MALSDNLVSYWKLDESSGNASDSVGTNTLTNNNTVSYASSLIGNGADFGSANTNKYFSRTDNLGITTNMSFSFWVKIQTEPASGEVQSFFIHSEAGADVRCAVGYQNSAGTRRLMFLRNKDGVVGNVDYYDVTLGTSAWHHIVFTYDGTDVKGYLDGTEVASVGSTGGGSVAVTSAFLLTGNTGTGLLATDYGTNGFAKAYMDEVGAWSRAITSSEVTELYNGGTGKRPFYISHDSSSYGEASGVSSVTYSHTCTGSDRILFVGALSQGADNVTGITYNGVSLTQINKQAKGSDYLYLYYLIAPATGANNVVVSRSSSTGVLWSTSSSYTGAKQSGVPDAQATTSNSGTSITGTVTTIDDNCWLVASVFCDNLGYSAGTGTVLRQSHSTAFVDSGSPTSPAGSDSLIVNCGSGTNAICVASFAPVSTAYTLTAETGTFTLTGQDADLNVGYTMTADTGTFTLTGFDAVLSRTGTTWTKVPKPTTTWTKTSKPSTTWTKAPKT